MLKKKDMTSDSLGLALLWPQTGSNEITVIKMGACCSGRTWERSMPFYVAVPSPHWSAVLETTILDAQKQKMTINHGSEGDVRLRKHGPSG